jgi:hypothetical protein
MREAGFAQRWKDVAASFGRLGFTAYGVPPSWASCRPSFRKGASG